MRTISFWLSRADAPFRGEAALPGVVDTAFDELAGAALAKHWPARTRSILFARRHANDPSDETTRPTSFPQAIRWLRGLLETNGLTLPFEGAESDPEAEFAPARTYQDGGVDIIVWKPFADEGPGFTVLLAQCTVQRAWRTKTRDISLTLWKTWVSFPGQVQKALVIPFSVDRDRWWWRDRTCWLGCILDRLRICELLENCDEQELAAATSAPTQDWLAEQAEAFSEANR